MLLNEEVAYVIRILLYYSTELASKVCNKRFKYLREIMDLFEMCYVFRETCERMRFSLI